MGLTIEECGVVGAGGGGFPTDVKLQTPVPLVIVNGAECEPLLHKDKELLRHEAPDDAGGPRRPSWSWSARARASSASRTSTRT